jgi:hypothetical protein
VACQQAEPARAESPEAQRDPHAGVQARARDQTLQRLSSGAEALRSRGPSHHPAGPDSQLSVIEQAVLEMPTAPLASAGDTRAAAAVAALADLDGVPAGIPGPARPNRPANPGSPTSPSPSGSASAAEPSTATPRPSRSGASSAVRRVAAAEANGPGHTTPPSTGDSSPGWLTSLAGLPPRRISAATSLPAGLLCGEGRRSRWPGTIVGVAAAGMYRPAPTCPPGRPP